jgi:ABC-type phosphate transport system substrate-binding protein
VADNLAPRGGKQRCALRQGAIQAVKATRFWSAVGVLGTAGALSLSLFAGTAGAAAPAAGVACAQDGKVNGRGATFALTAWNTFADGYRDDVCGAVTNTPADAAGNRMVIYNTYTTLTGSGNGRKAASCRTDAFGGSDAPYSDAQLAQLRGAPGAVGGCPTTAQITPPFMVAGPWPSANDVQAPIMSFPVAGSSEVVAVNLTGAACSTPPSALQFTAAMVDGLFDGTIATWNSTRLRDANNNGVVDGTGVDAALPPVNSGLANCTAAVTRRVRSDDSGTTQIFKQYLAKVDPSGLPCDGVAANTWGTLRNASPNTGWPGDAATPPAGCTQVVKSNGNQQLAPDCDANPGSVCYLDLADAVTKPNLLQPAIRNAADTEYVDPGVATRANCNFSTVSTPGGTASGAVGLNATDTWSNNQTGVIRSDITNLGTGYPICGLTFGLVYTGLSNTDPLVNDAISSLSSNQRRTLYSFLSYAMSSAGQDRLETNYYARLPVVLASLIRRGFQANF